MRHSFRTSTRACAVLLAGLWLAASAISFGAETSRPAQGFGPVYDAAHEITLTGTIQEVVSQHTPGSPAGVHLLVAGPQGTVDTHVGAFLSKESKDALQAGMPVQIVGAMLTLHSKDYLLARQITVGGRIITIRNAHGMLVSQHGPRATGATGAELNGGAQ